MAGLDPSPPDRPKAKYSGSAPASEDRPVVAPERFAVGRNRGVCLIGRAGPFARSIWVFLDHRNFAPDGPKTRLGFSCPNRDFSMGYMDFWRKKISRAFLPLGRRRRDGSRCSYDAETQCRSRASLTLFLLFDNQLPATEIVDSLLSPDGALSRIIADNQRYFTQSPTRREIPEFGC
jgi:hypothetical protein